MPLSHVKDKASRDMNSRALKPTWLSPFSRLFVCSCLEIRVRCRHLLITARTYMYDRLFVKALLGRFCPLRLWCFLSPRHISISCCYSDLALGDGFCNDLEAAIRKGQRKGDDPRSRSLSHLMLFIAFRENFSPLALDHPHACLSAH